MTEQNYTLLPFPNEFSQTDVEAFMDHLGKIAKASHKAIIIDCGPIEMIYSFGLGVLIRAYKCCNEKGIYFGLVNLSDSVRKGVEAAHLDRVINIFSIIEEFEIMQFDQHSAGTKVPALEFTYELIPGRYTRINCKGIMFKGLVFEKMISDIDISKRLIFDFSHLSFIDADCLKDLYHICIKTNVYAVSASDTVEEEIRMFELEGELQIFPDINSVQKVLETG